MNRELGSGTVPVSRPAAGDFAEAEGAIVRADVVVDRAALERMPRLRVLARTGVGVDLVDVAAATERGVAVVVTPGAGTRAVAEGVIGMALHLVKSFGPLTRLVREGQWARRGEHTVVDLDGATIGIIGYGRISRRVAELAGAFGMRILAHDPAAPCHPTTSPSTTRTSSPPAATSSPCTHPVGDLVHLVADPKASASTPGQKSSPPAGRTPRPPASTSPTAT